MAAMLIRVAVCFTLLTLPPCRSMPALENDILWQKYGKLRAELEELKAKYFKLAKLQQTQSGIFVAPKQVDTSTLVHMHPDVVPFGVHLNYASINLLANRKKQYVTEVSFDQDKTANCIFLVPGNTDVASRSITHTKDMARGILLVNNSDKPIVFSCTLKGSPVQVDFQFREPLNVKPFSSSYMARSFDGIDCSMSVPKHYANDSGEIIKATFSCRNFTLSENTTSMYVGGWGVKNKQVYDLISSISGRNIKFKGGNMEIQFSSTDKATSAMNNLLHYQITVQSAEVNQQSPLEKIVYHYYHNKALDGTEPPIKEGVVGIKIMPFSANSLRLHRGGNYTIGCYVIGNPHPAVLLSHNNRMIRSATKPIHFVWDNFVNSLFMEITNAEEEDEGEYVCEGSTGKNLVRQVQNVTLADTSKTNSTYSNHSSGTLKTDQKLPTINPRKAKPRTTKPRTTNGDPGARNVKLTTLLIMTIFTMI